MNKNKLLPNTVSAEHFVATHGAKDCRSQVLLLQKCLLCDDDHSKEQGKVWKYIQTMVQSIRDRLSAAMP